MSWRTLLAAAVGALLLATPLAARPATVPTGNLVVNPGAEDSPGSDVSTVVKPVGWTTTGNLSTWTYAAREGDRPTQAFSATIGGGKNFFAGGPGDNSGKQTTHTASQTIDVSGAATEIDASQVGATLTAFIGGYTVDDDLATVTARFLDAAGAALGSVRVGPVSIDDRKRLTVLLKRTAQANVPLNTRSIAVVITVTANGNGAHHAYIDNVSLTLGKAIVVAPPATAKPTLVVTCKAKTLTATVRPAKGIQGDLGDLPRRRQGRGNRQEGALHRPDRHCWPAGTAQGQRTREGGWQDHNPDQVDREVLKMDTLTLVAALSLAGVFGIAGVAKLRDRKGTRVAVRAFGAPALLVSTIALVLPLAELVVAGALLFPATRFAGAVGALGLLVLFTAAIAVSLARGRTPECHCFGQLHSTPTSWKTLVRNGLLGAVAGGLVIATRNDAGLSAWGWIAARTAPELGLIAGVLAVVTLITAIGASFLALTRAYGRILVRLDATEKALQAAGIELPGETAGGVSELGLDPGTPAPRFAMQLSNADPVTRDDLLAPGLPLLLVFTSPGCGPCHDLLPAVARWQRELDDRLTVIVASAGEPEAIRGQEAEHRLAPMLVDSDEALSEQFLTTGTPSAVLVAPDGTVASYVAAGSEEIETLVERVLSAPAEPGLPVGTDAPKLELRGIDGAVEPLVDPSGKDTLLLFWNPGCGYCQSLLRDLLAWETDPHDDAPRLLVVSSGDADETADDGFRSTVVLDSDFAAGNAFEAGGTPMAVVIDADGKVASPLLAGREAVLSRLAARHDHATRMETS